jgi:hypothetical protein
MLERDLLSYVSVADNADNPTLTRDSLGQMPCESWTRAIDFLADHFKKDRQLTIVLPPSGGVVIDEVPVPPGTSNHTLREILNTRARALKGEAADFQFMRHEGQHFIAGIDVAVRSEIFAAVKRDKLHLDRIMHAAYAWAHYCPPEVQILVDFSRATADAGGLARLLVFAPPRADYGAYDFGNNTATIIEDQIVAAKAANIFKEQPEFIHILESPDITTPHFTALPTTPLSLGIPNAISYAVPLLGAMGFAA